MKQITILVDDKVGVLADVSYLLGRSKVNIEAIAVGIVGPKAVVHLTVPNAVRALEVLKANGYQCLQSDLLVVKLANAPGELSKVSRLLADAGVNIESVSVLSQDSKLSLYAFKVDKPAKAVKMLQPYLSIEG